MIGKQQKRIKKKTRVLYIGECFECKVDIFSSDAFVVYASKKRKCWECHVKDSEKKD
jgi:hypothetical protein